MVRTIAIGSCLVISGGSEVMAVTSKTNMTGHIAVRLSFPWVVKVVLKYGSKCCAVCTLFEEYVLYHAMIEKPLVT